MHPFSVVGESVERHDHPAPSTRTARILRPGFITIIAGHVVVVDESQPVAASYSCGGGLVHVAGWSDLTVAPTAFTYPGRRFVDAGEAVFVQGGARGTPVIAIAASSKGALSIERHQGPMPDHGLYQPRLWAIPRSSRPDENWSFDTKLTDDVRFAAEVAYGSPGSALDRARFDEPASILHKRVDGSRAVICVQHCNKRPWVFAPSRTLHLVNGTGSGRLDERELVLPDISEFCFQVTLPEEELTARLVEYMQFSLGELSVLRDLASHSRLTVSGSAAQIRISTWFSLGHTPGVQYCRTDEPFDEFGNLAGRRFWNVRLDEDIAGGLPQLLSQKSNSEIIHI